MKYYFIVTLFLFFRMQAQYENTKWYFGDHVALDFMTNPPTVLNNSAMYTNEGCSSIADAAGNLLFYTDGVNIWNSQHVIMANGTSLYGNQTTSQSAIIVKHSGNTNLYYVFTMAAVGGTAGLNYSVVDMSLAAGMGSVTIKNSPLYNASCGEQLNATKHANGVDYWIMIHELNTNNFRAYLLNATGVNNNTVISSVGGVFTNGGAGQLKFSTTGQKIGVVVLGGINIGATLYDFNTSTGTVSNFLNLLSGNAIGNGLYGCEFSPDGTKFYAGNSNGLIQWDLNAGSNTAIVSSSIVLSSQIESMSNSGMQLAPNGKIYIASYGSYSISVINNPNNLGTSCNFVYREQIVSAAINSTLTSKSAQGLPTMLASPFSCALSLSNLGIFSCNGGSSGSIGVSGAYGNVSYVWSNGTTTYTTPLVNLSAGQWTVTVTDEVNCSVQSTINVSSTPVVVTPSISATSFSTCAGNTVTLNASGASSYTWSNGVQSSSIGVAPTQNTTYYVTGSDNNGYTGSSAAITVSIVPPPTLSINASNSFTLCSPQIQTLTVSGAYSYLWKWGSTAWATSTFLIVNPAVTTQYSITGTDENGCLSSKVLTITIGCVGVGEFEAGSLNLKVYPNPANDVLIIECVSSSTATMQGTVERTCAEWENCAIYDLLGNVIKNEKIKNKNGKAKINVSELKSGIYFIRSGNEALKFIKE